MTVTPAPGASVAVLGCGVWGRNLIRTFHTLGALAGVYDPDVAASTLVSEKHHVPARDLRAILDDDAIAAVAVAAPAAEHGRLARLVLEAGKHVFVEKPLSLRVEEAEELCELAESRQRVLMVGHLLQYHPAFEKLEVLVRGGDLGRLQYMYSNRLNFGRIRREENILWSFAPHDISMMLRLARAEPDRVWAAGSTFLHRTIADVTTTHLSFPSGIEGHVFVSWLHPFKEQKLIVIGDRGMAVFDDSEPWEAKLRVYPHEVSWRDGVPEPAKADAVAVEVAAAEPLLQECGHFLSCVTEGKTPRTDGREGVRVLKVLDSAERSMRAHAGPQLTGVATESTAGDAYIHASAVVDQPTEIGAGTRIWHFSHVLSGSRIGRDCVLGQNVMVGPDVTIGHGCHVQNNVSIYKGVTLEDGVFCGPSAVFTNVLIPRAGVDRRDEFRPTVVERGASIGANATIVCGHRIGAYAVIGAGAVVTQDVTPHSLMVGVPARHVGWVSHDGERLGDDLVCPRSGRRYRVSESGQLHELKTPSPADRTSTPAPVVLADLGAQRDRLGDRLDRSIRRVLEHQQFIMGPEVRELEERLAAVAGVEHAVSCGSGTDALLLPLLAWGVGPGDAVIVPSFTFTATAEVVSLVGATPMFVDVQANTGNLDPSLLLDAIRTAERSGLRVVGVIPVDLFGRPADYRSIRDVAADRGIWVMSDAAQSFGATVEGRPVGSLTTVTATSFFPSKPLGCYGDGGAVLTADASLADTMRSLRLHGRGAHKYDAVRVGMNSRLDTIQAAILLQKLPLLDDERERRERLAERYEKGLGDVASVPTIPPGVRSAWAQYTIRVDHRDQVAARMAADGIPSAVYYPKPLHQQRAYATCPRPEAGLTVSEALAADVLSLPMHPYLSDADQDRVIDSVRRALGA